jgi:hypothetical protein
MSRIVFVRSVPRESALGIHEWANDSSGIRMKKVKIGRATDTLRALYSISKGGLANYISYTPWIEDGVQVKDENGALLTLQDKMEQKWNKPKGYFTNRALMKGDNIPDEQRTYFQRKSWKMQDGSTVFDLDSMDGEMGYYVCLASSRVANSEKEWREHKWPKAQWYIAHENESDQIKYKRNEIKSKAFAALHDVEFTEVYKKKTVGILDISSTRANLTTEQVHNLLYDYVDASGFTPPSNIDKFMEVYRLLSTAHGRDEFEARFILKQALDTRIIYEKQGTYTWVRPSGQIVIGERYSEAVDFLLNPKKSAEVEELAEMISAKNS